MSRCGDCGFEAASPAGLASHRRFKHPPESAPGSNLQALEVTLGELDRLGRFEKVDEATVFALRSMATALDQAPQNAPLWRQYREALSEVLRADDDANDDLADALESIRS